jgi:hypothetical protein
VLGDIAKVQPKIIGALGKLAAMLFGASMTGHRSRKRTFQFQNIPLRWRGKGEAIRILRPSDLICVKDLFS